MTTGIVAGDVKATVTGEIVKQGKNKKVVVLKYKAKKGYRRKQGHRQPYTRVRYQGYQRLSSVMITAAIERDQKGSIRSLRVSGHSGYAEAGSDIICAGVSSLCYAAANALEDICGYEAIRN